MGCVLAQPAAPVYEDARVRILDAPAEPHAVYARVPLPGVVIHAPREVIVELLQRQGAPRNVCREILKGEYLHCHEPGPEWLGANLEIQFETDQTHVGILQIAPNASLSIPPAEAPPVLIALDGTEAEVVSHANGAPVSSGLRRNLRPANVLRSPADQVSVIRNTGTSVARFLVVEFGGPGE